MLEALWNTIKENYLKYVSLVFLWPMLVIGYVASLAKLKTVFIDTPIAEKVWWLYAIALTVVGIVYTVMCVAHNMLPRASRKNLGVLFVIHAENRELFESVRYKLRSHINELIEHDGADEIALICISGERIPQFHIKNKNQVVKLLEKTNCSICIDVTYNVDDKNHAENYEMIIHRGGWHPRIDESANLVLENDVKALEKTVERQRFSKDQVLDVFCTTAQTLSYACHYILGVVGLVSGDLVTAVKLLEALYYQIDNANLYLSVVPELKKLVQKRLYTVYIIMMTKSTSNFEKTKDRQYLNEMKSYLERANTFVPDTYTYYLNMAYVHIALDGNSREAKVCIEKCQQTKQRLEWMISRAFLYAYADKYDPMSICSYYRKAFDANPNMNLISIIDYVEYMIEKEPKRINLHLAVGLLYERVGDVKLMKYHFSRFLVDANNLDKRVYAYIENAFNKSVCSEKCNKNCVECAA